MSLGRSAGAPPGGLPGNNGGDAGWRSAESTVWKPGRRFRDVARGALDDVVTTFFPAGCPVCKGPLLRAGGVPVCAACMTRAVPQTESLCTVCGEALGMESERLLEGSLRKDRVCPPCRKSPPGFERAVAFGVYEGELREMIHLLKYERVRTLSKPLGRLLASSVEQLADKLIASENAADVLVVAVPLFRSKKRGRGFNHAELLANAALAELRKRRPQWKLRAAHRVMQRVRDTESQFGLSPHGRRVNLRGAFRVPDEGAVDGRDVLLIDDIYTSGATARACAQVLRRAGARTVLVATLARAQRESVAMWDARDLSAAAPFVNSRCAEKRDA